jgi:uncharacterized protein (DUF433 family)
VYRFTVTPSDPIIRAADTLEGQAAFARTRVPVWVLFRYLTDERALAAFSEAYPQVARDDILAVLDLASRALTGQDSHGETAGADVLQPPTHAWGEWGELVALLREHEAVLTDDFARDLAEAHALVNTPALADDPRQR